MAPPPRTRYRFTDPLGAAAADHVRPAEQLLRRAMIGLFAIASATLGITLLTPDSNTSDHAGIALVGVVTLLIAGALKLWREPPDAVLLALLPIGSLLVTVLCAIARPLALIPMFYIWPLVIAAYCLQRRELLLNYLLVVVGFAVALQFAVPDARTIMWVSVAVVGAVLVGLIAALKEGLHTALARLRDLATHDPLTGALNRRAFAAALDAAIARAHRGEDTCAVAVIDIDHFKDINDRFGHAAGDRALQRLVRLLQDRARRGDAVGRLGGEEFAVLLDGGTAAGGARFAEDLRVALADCPPGEIAFTVSAGVAELGDGTGEDMLHVADRALYAAKAGGRDRVMRHSRGCTAAL